MLRSETIVFGQHICRDDPEYRIFSDHAVLCFYLWVPTVIHMVRRKEGHFVYLRMHSTLFITGYMALNTW